MFANCLGMCTVFLIIFADILIGDKDDPDGLISVCGDKCEAIIGASSALEEGLEF